MAKTSKKDSNKETVQFPLAKSESIEVTVPWEVVEKPLNKRITQSTKTIKLDGFRKGKIPADMARKYLDITSIKHRAIEDVIVPLFIEATKAAKLEPIGYPEIIPPAALPENQDWVVSVEFAVKPEIKLGNYKKIIADARKKALAGTKKDEKQELIDEAIAREIYRSLIEKINPEVPELLMKQETNSRLQDLVKNLEQMKVNVADYLANTNQTEEQLIAQKQADAVASLQIEFIIQSLIEAEKLAATDADVEEKIATFKDKKIQAQIKNDQRYQARLKESIKREKLIAFLLDKPQKKTDKKA